jgi:hypothetical protein
MSLSFRTVKEIQASDLFGSRLEKYGVREAVSKDPTETDRWLTDGQNYLCVHAGSDGPVLGFTAYGAGGDCRKISHAIMTEFNTGFVFENEPEYWGYKTRDEWVAAWS